MTDEMAEQFDHTWKILASIVEGFDDDAWLHAQRGSTTPARLTLHILQGTKYYTENTSTVAFASGKPFDINPETADEDSLPSREDLMASIRDFRTYTKRWLDEMDVMAVNTSFPWAGKTQMGVALFLLRHSTYHAGELSALLNESRAGQTEDHWVSTL